MNYCNDKLEIDPNGHYLCFNLSFYHLAEKGKEYTMFYLLCKENCVDSEGNSPIFGFNIYTPNLKIDHSRQNPLLSKHAYGDHIYIATNNNQYVNYLLVFTPILYRTSAVLNTKSYEYVDTSYSGFIRVFMMKIDNKNKLYSPELYYNYGEYYNAGPFYCWTSGKTTSSNILDIYPGIKTVQIPSDIPFYVHTVWHENDLGTNPDEWEYYVFQSCDHTDGGIGIDESFISEAGCACVNATDFNTPYIYQIPLTEVPSGSYYTTIVHYADGSSVMTDVRRK